MAADIIICRVSSRDHLHRNPLMRITSIHAKSCFSYRFNLVKHSRKVKTATRLVKQSTGGRRKSKAGAWSGRKRTTRAPAAELTGDKRRRGDGIRGWSGRVPAACSQSGRSDTGRRRVVAASELKRVTSGNQATAKEAGSAIRRREERSSRRRGSMRVRGRTRSWRASRSASRSGSDSDSHGQGSNALRSGHRLDSLSHSLNFWSCRTGGFSVDIDHGVIDFAANDVFLGIGKRRRVGHADRGEGDQSCDG